MIYNFKLNIKKRTIQPITDIQECVCNISESIRTDIVIQHNLSESDVIASGSIIYSGSRDLINITGSYIYKFIHTLTNHELYTDTKLVEALDETEAIQKINTYFTNKNEKNIIYTYDILNIDSLTI